MDSLTQIVLGAAAGEVVLGKKIGNRAMLWGAVGGTIPDMDVVGKYFLSEIDNLAFHRGITHSILFSVLGAIFFGWLIYSMYKSPYHKWIAIFCKSVALVIVCLAINFVLRIFVAQAWLPTAVIFVLLSFLFFKSSQRKYFDQELESPNATRSEWQWLMFWALFTHPILDCFTMYGTQLFAPFSDMRVAWSTISVADPLYTVPFITCLIIASCYNRSSPKRRIWNYLGIALSSAYLVFTAFNKNKIESIYEESLAKQGISYERYVTSPSILNNVLWTCTLEAEDSYYQGQYSLFDTKEINFVPIKKNHQLLKNIDTDPTIKTLRWFCEDYFNVQELGDGRLMFNDLRFGSFGGEKEEDLEFIFRFLLTEKNNSYEMQEARGGPDRGREEDVFTKLLERIKGN